MTLTSTTRRTPHRFVSRRAFTLTEVLIALALVSLLLVGISRVFALTSATIGQGQALSGVLRIQKALQQAFDADLRGSSTSGVHTGLMPIDGKASGSTGQPAIIISNFRVAAFPTRETELADIDYQQLVGNDLLDDVKRSNAIRSEDSTGIVIPRYAYGDRNFRIDSFSFFASGDYSRQTPNAMDPATASASNPWSPEKGAPADLHSNEAWIWYGHLRLFNSDGKNIELSRGYGAPGLAQTEGAAPTDGVNNKNNLYASQFTLGRMAILLKEPTDHDGDTLTYPTVVGASSDVQSHIYRFNTNNNSATWWFKADDNILFTTTANGSGRRTSRYPLVYGADTRIYDRAAVTNHRNLSLNVTPPIAGTIESGRSDVAGVSAGMFRDRLAALYEAGEDAFASGQTVQPPSAPQSSYGPSVTAHFTTWHEDMFARTTLRPWGNPFPAIHQDSNGNVIGYTSRDMSQRSMILAQGCSSFIVEFAGDFGTQAQNGAFVSARPDGILDYVSLPDGSRAVRWYGMPRDVDQDGRIPGGVGNAAVARSIDVVPVRDLVGGVLASTGVRTTLPFEKSIPPLPSNNDYMNDLPATAANEAASYVCAWGPQEFDGRYRANGIYYQFQTAGVSYKYQPWLLRIIADIRDETGKLQQPIAIETIYSVPAR